VGTCTNPAYDEEVKNTPDRRWLLLFLIAALLLGGSRWRVSGQAAGLIPAARREPTPEMALQQLGGGEWKLADHRGHVVLMNFWATWCEPCRDEMPALAEVLRHTAPQGVTMVGVSVDRGPSAQALVQQFQQQYRLPWTIAFPDARLRMRADGISIPTTVLLDKQGRRARTYVGEVDRDTLAQDVAALLAEN
jgi:cytochrome c biogenesis protein CcmG/thiol:disulfide interchange protein DsbE